MRVVFVLIVAGVLLSACSRSPIPGAKDIGSNTFWKLRVLGEGDRLPTDSDSVLLRIRIARLGAEAGSLFSTEQWYAMQQLRPHAAGSWTGRMHQGDSATVAVDARQLPWNELGAEHPQGVDSGWVTVELSMRAMRSLADYRAEQQALVNARTPADEEENSTNYLSTSQEKWAEFMGVLYVLDPAHGKGAPVQSGQRVTMDYTASFLDNGQVFDDTRRSGVPLTFRLGDPDQVIKGLEIAAHVLPAKAGRGSFIIPSAYAFGPTGSSSGIVPPWTPVRYDIEVRSALPDSVDALP